jgi:two-component system cell cycle response regulator
MNAVIVVLDDDMSLARTVTRVLADDGHAARAVVTLGELERELAAGRCDLLLADPTHLLEHELRHLAHLLRHGPGAPRAVLLMSEHLPGLHTMELLDLDPGAWVAKPFRVQELLAVVRASLRRTAAEAPAAVTRSDEEILAEVAGVPSADEFWHLLVRRIAVGLGVPRCAVVLARPGDETGTLAAAFEDPALPRLRVTLARYPEIRRALETGTPVLVEDILTDPLYAEERAVWARDGLVPGVRSALVLPFVLHGERAGVVFLRTTDRATALTPESVAFTARVVGTAVAALDSRLAG